MPTRRGPADYRLVRRPRGYPECAWRAGGRPGAAGLSAWHASSQPGP